MVKNVIAILLIAVAAEAFYLFAPLAISPFLYKRDAKAAVALIPENLRGSRLQAETWKRIENAGFERDKVQDMRMLIKGNQGHLTFTYVKTIALFDYELYVAYYDVDVTGKLLNPMGR